MFKYVKKLYFKTHLGKILVFIKYCPKALSQQQSV
jgi:hypothetical protein